MSSRKIWFITGAGRGMGADFAKAALAAGHAVVASGRDRDSVAKALGPSDGLLAVKLDVTQSGDAEAAVRAAVDRFGRIDVLVNNAASFYAGYFEELTPEQMERQLATSLMGPMNVTRAVLPVMRKQRSTSAERSSSSSGKPRMACKPAIRPSSRAEQKVADLKAQIDAHRDLSTSLDLDREPAALAV